MTNTSPSAPPVKGAPLWIPTPRGPAPGPAEIGGKAYHLARLARMGLAVPRFFVLRADALARLLGGGALPETEEEAERARERAERAPLPDELREALREALRLVGHGPLAVRSSAVGEDGARSSFAGQFETVLGVLPDEDEVWRAVRRVWASAFHPRVMAYRRERGEGAGAMAVVVQHLVQPVAAGVAFSVDPVSGDGATAVVSAVYGLGEGLVSGMLDADTYHVRTAADGGATVEAKVAHKPRALRFDAAAGEVRAEDVAPALRDEPALTEAEARAVAMRVRTLAASFGAEQDVEWALGPGPEGPRQLFLLQTRPITTLGDARPGALRVWDNESVVESLPGVTLPLTYSVARRAFGNLYAGHCLAMGASERAVADHQAVFHDIVGLVRGRVYVDTATLNRVYLLIPGMELRDRNAVPRPGSSAAPDEPRDGPLPPDLLLAARELNVPGHVLRSTARLAEELEAFRARVREVLNPLAAADFRAATPDELRGHYESLDRGLLSHWRGPMLNDSLVPFWTELLRHMVGSWLPGTPPGPLANQLVAGGSDLVSAQPVRLLAALAERVRGDAPLQALLAGDATGAEVWEALHADPAFAEVAGGLGEFLERFGDRCPDELKLEAASYADSPEALVQALRACAAGGQAPAGSGEVLRAQAEALVRERLPAERSAPFFAVVEQARLVVRERENHRFERTRAFGVMRRLFAAMGARLAGAGALADPQDVFYLTTDELFGWLDGHAASGDLRALVAARRAEFDAYRLLPEPPHRFATRGPPALSALEPFARSGPPAGGADGVLRGMGCCPGVVRAAVRVVRDPRQPGELAGRILVAEQTDPGWTLLFPAAAGVLVERGNILSHAALVARELGVPCVVGIPGLLDTLRDGEQVEMDGATGMVRRVKEADSA
ncbi:PEP/pyruvate-binding domain-containing protein [Longimicrobium sp.]|uniref:PEP/pyruvate-binding domain-containing protein n=1 Tax=Longimicrobium sp. TaxID=2029185 RepID=UPI003B3A58D3